MISLPQRVEITDVGPRDGLQVEAKVLSVGEKREFIERLSAAGIRRIEFSSFVNPARVPQLADAEELFRLLPDDGVDYMALIANPRGYDRAVHAGVRHVRFTVIASETFNRKNFNRSIGASLSEAQQVFGRAGHDRVRVTGTVGAAFGCPYEGDVPRERVVSLVARLSELGATEVVLADTTGVANPLQVARLLEAVLLRGACAPLGCHFHNTRNLGFANVLAALSSGVSRFDAGLGGIGGCPFAPGASGNIATEDLVNMLDGMGIETGADLPALIDASHRLARLLGHELPGQVARFGPGASCATEASASAAVTSVGEETVPIL